MLPAWLNGVACGLHMYQRRLCFTGQLLNYAKVLLQLTHRTHVFALLTNLEDAILLKVTAERCEEAQMQWCAVDAESDGIRCLIALRDMTATELGAVAHGQVPKDYSLTRFLGKGNFGDVFAAKCTAKAAADVVVKLFRNQDQQSEGSYETEVAALEAIATATSDRKWSKYQDYLPTLVECGKARGRCFIISSPACLEVFGGKRPFLPMHARHLLLAVRFLHVECDCRHGDINPSNLMVNAYGGLVLIDFGSSSRGKEVRLATGTIITMSQALLDAFATKIPRELTVADDLESCFKSVKLLTDVFLGNLVLKVVEHITDNDNKARTMQALWADRGLAEMLRVCEKNDYDGLLSLLTDAYAFEPTPAPVNPVRRLKMTVSDKQADSVQRRGQPLTPSAKRNTGRRQSASAKRAKK